MNIATEVNKEVLGQIAAESIAKINPNQANGKRWINAIAKATAEIETNPQVDTLIKPFLRASEQSRTRSTLTAKATTPSLQSGIHILYFFAANGSDATSINPARPSEEKYNEVFDFLAPESSPIIGGINAYLFLVASLNPTAASVTVGGRVLSPAGRGLARTLVTLTDGNGETREALTNSFGYYRFTDVAAGADYIVNVRSKRYWFAPQFLSASKDTAELNFAAQSR